MVKPTETAGEPKSRERTASTRSIHPAYGVPWHAYSADDVIEGLASERNGLTQSEAEKRLEAHGPNSLPMAKSRSALMRFLAQFHDVLIYVLLAAAVVAALLGHGVDTAVILLVVLMNAVIGFVQEGRAEKALDAIKGMITPNASVLRDGRRIIIRAEEVVPGDIVLLEAGDRVPTDLRLIRARNLKIEEAILTGESVAVEKGVGPVDAAAALGDRTSMAYSGTFAVAGQGLGVAVATGLSTELGRISAMLGTVEPLATPLVRQMNRFARHLTIVILGGAVLVFAFAAGFRSYAWSEAFMVVVGLAVAAIPEGLPAVMTITLAIGVQRMAARNAIIRRLHAVETLGSVSVICSDKTGTLTRNEMMVQTALTAAGAVEVTGEGYEPRGALWHEGREFDVAENPVMQELALAALLCNDAALRQADSGWIVDGDPMEGALVSFAEKAGYEIELTRKQFPRADEIPFDSRHRFMATLHHRHENGAVTYVKGAPEQVLSMCPTQHGAHGPERIDPAYWSTAIEALASEGQRVLALATKKMPQGMQDLTFQDVEDGLSLLGIVGLIDPPRTEAIMAVEDCRSAGIRVKMITGDHAATASAIAQRLGLVHFEAVITGEGLQGLDGEEFKRAAREMTVFARTSPEHKLRLVEALQSDGGVVAMTGDGVNDAPALKRADVGIAMGRKGTEAAKEAAEMVLADDNFASIVAAVREGRTVYDNLKKVIGWTLPTNGGEAMAIIAAIIFGLTLPMTPVQILWINMVTAVGLGLTLAFEPTEPDVMHRSPRPPYEPILSGFLVWRVVFVSLLFVAGSFGMFFWAEARGLPIEEARTIVVNAIVIMEIFYLFSVRRHLAAAFPWTGLLGAPAIVIGVGIITGAQFLFTYAPFMQAIFATRSISLMDGIAVIGVGAGLFLVLEFEKLVRRQSHLSAPFERRRYGEAYVMAREHAFEAAGRAASGAGNPWQVITGALVVLALGSGLAYWILHAGVASRYVTETAGPDSTIRTVTATGVVDAMSSESVGAHVSGVVQALYCDRGDRVKAGELCVKINPGAYKAIVDREKSELAAVIARHRKNQLRLARAKAALERAQISAKRGTVSRQALANSRAAHERAKARMTLDETEIARRREALRAAEIDLTRTDVVSPIDGTVVSRGVEIGQTIETSKDTQLFHVAADLHAVRVEADVNAKDLGEVRLGDKASFTVDAFPDRTFNGEVTQVRGPLQPTEKKIGRDIVISASNPDLALTPGMEAKIQIVIHRRDDDSRVPNTH